VLLRHLVDESFVDVDVLLFLCFEMTVVGPVGCCDYVWMVVLVLPERETDRQKDRQERETETGDYVLNCATAKLHVYHMYTGIQKNGHAQRNMQFCTRVDYVSRPIYTRVHFSGARVVSLEIVQHGGGKGFLF